MLGAARFYLEHKQMEQRLRLDVPTLADPATRSLLQESDLFVRSFSGGGFGMLSPLDFIQVISLMVEIASQLFLIISLTRGALHITVLLISGSTILLPIVLSWISCSREQQEPTATAKEARACDRQERLRNLAYSDAYRPEIALFGLGDWILKSWTSARKVVLSYEQPAYARNSSIIDQFNLMDLLNAIQNVRVNDSWSSAIYSVLRDQIPLLLLLKGSSATLGSVTVYRTSIHSLIFTSRNLVTTTKMVFQGLFLMSAFIVSMGLKPKLNPKREEMVHYTSVHGGAKIKARYALLWSSIFVI